MTNKPRGLRTLLVVPADAAGNDIAATLVGDARFHVIARHTELVDARVAVDGDKPDLVLCHASLRKHPDYPKLIAVAEANGAKLAAVPTGASATIIAQAIGLSSRLTPDFAPRVAPDHTIARRSQPRLVVIGASTGGIDALQRLLSGFPTQCPPTAIVQHIKPEFLSGVVARLNRHCAADVIEATPRTFLRPGQVALAPGLARHLEIEPVSRRCRLRAGPAVSGHRPSVDRLFHSVARLGPDAVGVLLTGMGRDGATGLGAMRAAGAWTIAQDAATSTVFGMPRVAHDEGAVCELLPLPRICDAILHAAHHTREVAQ